jgi:hypothetical protein
VSEAPTQEVKEVKKGERTWEVLAILHEVEGVAWSVMEAWGALYRAFSVHSGGESGKVISQMRDEKTGALVLIRYSDK